MSSKICSDDSNVITNSENHIFLEQDIENLQKTGENFLGLKNLWEELKKIQTLKNQNFKVLF
jgi:hypothetical protein